jgi:hypothetical protein
MTLRTSEEPLPANTSKGSTCLRVYTLYRYAQADTARYTSKITSEDQVGSLSVGLTLHELTTGRLGVYRPGANSRGCAPLVSG